MLNPTASALERVLECSSSHVLPAVYDSSEYAERGVEIARFIRSIIGGGSVEAALSLVREEWRDTCRHLQWKKIVGDLSNVRGEVAYALDTANDGVRELGINIGRRYPLLTATEIGGTDDIEGERLDDVPVVIDVKTGQDVTACQDNPQIKFFCHIKQLLTGANEVEGRIAYVREDGAVTLDCHTFTAFDLECFGDDLAELVTRVADARRRLALGEALPVNSGSWCRYCPAMAACPKYTALAKAMVPELDAIAERLQAMTPEQQGIAFTKAKDIERLLESVLTSLKEIAKQSPIPLPNDKLVKEIRFPREDFSQKSALELLRAKGATAEEIAKVYVTSSVGQVRVVNAPSAKKPRRRRAA